jgi:hypothetical protein
MVVNRLHVLGLPIRCQAHDLVLPGIDLESGVVRKRRVQQPERMGKGDLPQRGELVLVPHPGRCRGPLPDPVHAQNGRRAEGGREERGGRVCLMVFGKQQGRQRGGCDAGERRQFLAQQRFQKQLFLQPDWQGGHKGAPAAGRKRQIRLQEPLELHEWFVIKNNVAQIREGTMGLVQAVADGMAREARVLFLPCKPLFLRCGKNGPITDQACGAVVVKG